MSRTGLLITDGLLRMEPGLGNQGIPQMTGLGASIEMRGEDIRHIMKIGSTETDTVQSGTKPGRKKSENGKSRGIEQKYLLVFTFNNNSFISNFWPRGHTRVQFLERNF